MVCFELVFGLKKASLMILFFNLTVLLVFQLYETSGLGTEGAHLIYESQDR